jgi:spore coat protein U-like protein
VGRSIFRQQFLGQILMSNLMSSVTSVRLALAAALVVSSGSFNPALAAASAAGTMDVNLAIVSGCDFTATDMDFGIHNFLRRPR